eukprot:COSAG06_NODE_2320_length_7089_cov_5.139628_10_plen_117_part_00
MRPGDQVARRISAGQLAVCTLPGANMSSSEFAGLAKPQVSDCSKGQSLLAAQAGDLCQAWRELQDLQYRRLNRAPSMHSAKIQRRIIWHILAVYPGSALVSFTFTLATYSSSYCYI